jgi:hypothetical protein
MWISIGYVTLDELLLSLLKERSEGISGSGSDSRGGGTFLSSCLSIYLVIIWNRDLL